MNALVFATTNDMKFETAYQVCDAHDILLQQQKLDVVEVQDESAKNVAIAKAKAAYDITQQPVVISDDSWNFPGLGGFPGVYMHSMNEWFTPEDFLRLTAPLTDRRAILTQYVVYFDGKKAKVFQSDSEAQLLKEIRGSSKYPSHTVTGFPQDDGKSIAEALAGSNERTGRQSARIWHQFAEWYKSL